SSIHSGLGRWTGMLQASAGPAALSDARTGKRLRVNGTQPDAEVPHARSSCTVPEVPGLPLTHPKAQCIAMANTEQTEGNMKRSGIAAALSAVTFVLGLPALAHANGQVNKAAQ